MIYFSRKINCSMHLTEIELVLFVLLFCGKSDVFINNCIIKSQYIFSYNNI